MQQTKEEYGNWVSAKMIRVFAIGFVFFLILAVLSFSPPTASWQPWLKISLRVLLLLAAAVTFLTGTYFYLCRRFFSYHGKYQVQNKILDYVLSHLELKEGHILDIGCGNGALSIKAARKFPQVQITAIDYWGAMWEFSQRQCETNARSAEVEKQITFQRGDAAALSFPDATFDAAISNFVFHEVQSVKNKREVVREALRVVKPGGSFVFHDLFLEPKFYGDMEAFVAQLRKEGIAEVYFLPSAKQRFIPALLKTRPMLGRIGLLYGKK